MKLANIEDFMKYADFFYICVGIEPYTKGNNIENQRNLHANRTVKLKIRLRQMIFYVNVINLSAALIGEAAYVLLALLHNEHILEAIMNMAYIGFVLVGMSKLLFVWSKKCQLTNFMQELEKLFPRDISEQRAYELERYLKNCARLSFNFSLLYAVLIWTYNFFTILQYFIYERWLKTRIIGKTLPYNMYIPWQWEGHWSYYVLLVFENLAGLTSAAGQMSTDLLLCAAATQIIMHYDYLARTLESYVPTLNYHDDHKFLSGVIIYHERILKLSHELNNIFGTPLLLNFCISSFTICFVAFHLTTGVTVDMFIKLFLYLASSMSQASIISHFGQLLKDASDGISLAAYNQSWYDADIRYKKMLVLIMKRAQQTAFLRATVFLKVSRVTITELLQTSYRFFALLKTMYEQDETLLA